MKVSDKGLLEICEHEGIVPTVYFDSVGVKTYGVGHTKEAGDPDPNLMPTYMPAGDALDEAVLKAIRVFGADVEKYAARVNRAITVPLKQHQFDALVSFDFNTGGIFKAQLTKQINSGDFSGKGFMGWLRPPEIRDRREAEMRLFLTGDYDANGTEIPVWGTNGVGKLTRPVKMMEGHEVLKKMWPGYTPTSPKRSLVSIIIDLLTSLFKKG